MITANGAPNTHSRSASSAASQAMGGRVVKCPPPSSIGTYTRRVNMLQPRIVPSGNGVPCLGGPCLCRTATLGCLESSPHTTGSPMGFLELCLREVVR